MRVRIDYVWIERVDTQHDEDHLINWYAYNRLITFEVQNSGITAFNRNETECLDQKYTHKAATMSVSHEHNVAFTGVNEDRLVVGPNRRQVRTVVDDGLTVQAVVVFDRFPGARV